MMLPIQVLSRRAVRWVLSLFIVILLAAQAPQSAAAQQVEPGPAALVRVQPGQQAAGDGKFQSEPCTSFDFTLPANWIEGSDVTCGYLTVPEEHGSSSAVMIKLAVVIIKSTNPNPPPDPLVLLQGGPGGSTIDTYTQLLPISGARLRKDRDLILFDQRGTLYSKPALTCPEMLDMTIQNLDVKLTPDESQQKSLEALKACRARLAQAGVNLSAFDSLQNAADVESLRAALGYDQINLYGVSYGTLLALHVMRSYPQGLRSVILDSTVPPQKNFLLDAPRSQNRSFEALFAACAADSACNSAYPNLRQVFYDEIDQLNKTPVHINLTDRDTHQDYQALLDGDTLLVTTFQMMYNTEIIPLVPKTIYDIRAGNYDFLERILSLVVFDRSMAEGMYYSVNCAEEVNFNPNDFSLEGLPPEIQALSKNDAKDFLQTCQAWDVKPLEPTAEQAVQSDIPTLVLSGAFDPITPPDYGQLAAQTLPHSSFVSFPNGGHGEMLSGECPDKVVISFLANPQQAPDTSCVSQLGGPEFVTPGSVVSLPKLINLLNLEGTSGPEMIGYFLSLLLLLTALGVYPLIWLVRLITRQSRPAAAVPAAPQPYGDPQAGYPAGAPAAYSSALETGGAQAYSPPGSAAQANHQRGFYRLAPWLAALTTLVLLGFTIVMIVILFNMVAQNDQRLLVGLPGAARPLFVLPILAVLLTVLMVAAMLMGWTRRAGSIWGRLYFSLLSIAALACVVILGLWGMVTALF